MIKTSHVKSIRVALLMPLALMICQMAGMKSAAAQIQSEGAVPADLKMSVMELYESNVERAQKYSGNKIKDHQPLLEASYHIGKMMANGRIVYGDPISKMVERIADTLLTDYPELRSELRFYTVKSPEVNAFATGQGMVFVNAGLVAQAENEAQLAFIISHEIIHYYRSHVMEELVGKEKKKRTTDDERKDMDEFLRKHNRSHEMENEADSLGIAMFYLKSPYDKNVGEGVFDVLQYSELPFDDVRFDTNWFNNPYYELKGCWLDTTASITSRDDYDDSRSSHPNILTRRRKTAIAMDGYYGGEQFVTVTKEQFEEIRNLARAECIRQELLGGEYSRAFYNAWLLYTDKEENRGKNRETIAEYMAQALYGVAMFKNHNGTNSVAGDYNKIEGESQQVYYAMRQMTNEQATLAALHRIWQLHGEYPNNEAIAVMATDLMDEVRVTHKLTFSSFQTTPPAITNDEDTVQIDDRNLTKYERIKKKRQSTQTAPLSYALTDLMMKDSTFVQTFRNHVVNGMAPKQDEKNDSIVDGDIFLYSTSYWTVNDNTGDLKVEKSMKNEQTLTDMVIKAGNRFGRGTVDFSDRGLHNMSDASQYNDFVTLNEWLTEFWQTKGLFQHHRLTQEAMDDLIDRYGATTVNVVAVLNSENTSVKSENLAASILFIPLAPIAIYDMVASNENTQMAMLVIDAANGKVLSRESHDVGMPDSRTLVNSMVYDSYKRAFKGKPATGVQGLRLALMGGVQLAMPGLQPISKIATFTPWASAEFAINPKNSLAIGWSHIGAFDEYNSKTFNEWIQDTPYSRHYGPVYHTDLDYSKEMTTWSLTYRHYSDGFAPMGRNYGLGAHMVHFVNPSDNTSGGNSFGIHVSGGVNYVFFNRIVLNLEARYGYTVGFVAHGINDFGDETKYKMDALLHNFLQLRIGIGVMPF